MTTIFCIRPATPNIGNNVINRATVDLLRSAFPGDLSIVNLPAIASGGRGGLTSPQVYDMNRLADGVVVGGGNLFENGQLTVNLGAVEALTVPMMLIGLSHGRIYDAQGLWTARSDSLPSETIRKLVEKADVAMVRDHASQAILANESQTDVELGGCPTLFMRRNEQHQPKTGRVLLSIRHPARMSVPPALQWRTPEDVRKLVAALRETYGPEVYLVCHDYMDLEFAAGFPDVPRLYFDDVDLYIEALRACRLNVTYRLHAFLPCVSFGVPSIHLSYDERGRSMVETAGMGDWQIDLMQEPDPIGAVLCLAARPEAYHAAALAAARTISPFAETTKRAIARFAESVRAHSLETQTVGGRDVA